jgi:carboxypeptidase C (cathepsin A)
MSDTTSPTDIKTTPQDNLSITRHTVAIGGQTIAYTVTAGTIVLKEEAEKQGEEEGASEGEKPKASIFFIAYTKDDVVDPASRPLTFSFNGGPGSSSVWLHLGVLGPRRVLLDDDGFGLRPPYKLVDNEASLLDVTDLVFIDPVSTGFSRPAPGEKAKEFHGFTKDIESVGDFIRLYTSRYRRWLSPKFLVGESYGTTRAAGLSGHLQERHGLWLNGIMLVSSILDFQTADFDPGNDLPALLFLPTYTATAWYHRRLPADLQALPLAEVLAQVEAFALGDYALALLQGTALPTQDYAGIVQQLARFTGLSQDYVERNDLRIDIFRFIKELLRPAAAHRGPAGQPLHRHRSRCGRRALRVRPQLQRDSGRLHRVLQRLRARRSCSSRATCPTRFSRGCTRPGATRSSRTSMSAWLRRCARRSA